MVNFIQTEFLNIAYEEFGDPTGRAVVLIHGWPDDPHCWDKVTPKLCELGYRILTPYLRGCSPTTFRDKSTLRSGAIAAIGQDLADFINGLNLSNVLVVGHDWGARAGYVVAALFSNKISGLVALSAGYATSKPIHELPFNLMKAYWYEWLVTTKQGHLAFENNRRQLCRYLWKDWSPGWKFTDEEFETAAASWDNDDWAPISIHAYLQRWGEVPGAAENEDLERQLRQNPPIRVPTMMLHGEKDADNLIVTSESKDCYFVDRYERKVLPDVGHFIPREAPEQVVDAIQQLASGKS